VHAAEQRRRLGRFGRDIIVQPPGRMPTEHRINRTPLTTVANDP
jgi:hypothetical protein